MHFVVKSLLVTAMLFGHLRAIPIGHASPFGGRLVDRAAAQHYGLQRAWVTQVQVNPARNYIENCKLSYDSLTTVTSAGIVQLIDLTSGRTMWTTRVGNPSYPNLGPDVDEDSVAVINGTTLYVLRRDNGRAELVQRLAGAPSAAPALADGYVYVPLLNGRVIGYPLDDALGYPWYYQSAGRVAESPLASHGWVFWGTSEGYFYAGEGGKPGIQYRMETPSAFAAAPVRAENAVLSVTSKGDLIALEPASGAQIWKFAAGYPAYRPPAAIGKNVFFAAEQPALHCIDVQSGDLRWTASGVNQFAAASKFHVYGFDPYGTIHILDVQSGTPLARVATGGAIQPVANDQNDRLLLLSENGMLQCLHELGANEPIYYVSRPGAVDDVEVTEEESAVPESATTPYPDQADSTDPFVDDPLPEQPAEVEPEADEAFPGFDEQSNPFGIFGESAEDAGDAPEDENSFF